MYEDLTGSGLGFFSSDFLVFSSDFSFLSSDLVAEVFLSSDLGVETSIFLFSGSDLVGVGWTGFSFCAKAKTYESKNRIAFLYLFHIKSKDLSLWYGLLGLGVGGRVSGGGV
jgi:hypothetical protein